MVDPALTGRLAVSSSGRMIVDKRLVVGIIVVVVIVIGVIVLTSGGGKPAPTQPAQPALVPAEKGQEGAVEGIAAEEAARRKALEEQGVPAN
jgi:hypothetical protein